MIDQIKSKVLNTAKNAVVDAQNDKKVSKSQSVVEQAKSKSQLDNSEKNISKFVSKDTIKNMAKEPPVDKVNISRIKNAIANGSYPVDLEKISDALFNAYKEMKN